MGISCDTLLRSTSGTAVVNGTPAVLIIPPCESPDNTVVGTPVNTVDVGKLALLYYNACKVSQKCLNHAPIDVQRVSILERMEVFR